MIVKQYTKMIFYIKIYKYIFICMYVFVCMKQIREITLICISPHSLSTIAGSQSMSGSMEYFTG